MKASKSKNEHSKALVTSSRLAIVVSLPEEREKNVKGMEKIQYKIKTVVGPLYLVASSKGLNGVYFFKQPLKSVTRLDLAKEGHKTLCQAEQQLREYFAGERKEFDVPYELFGTPFQKKVWQALLRIPFGQTVSYRDIAQRIKNPKAVRAVGSANGKNPVCIMIPCHRVIAADGTLGGYSSGIPIKIKLLRHEGLNRF